MRTTIALAVGILGAILGTFLGTFLGLVVSGTADAQTAPPTITPEAQLSLPVGRTASAVEISHDIAVVGSDGYPSSFGLVQIFRRQNGIWTAQGTLTRPNAFIGDRFGSSLEWDGRTLVVGSPGDPSGADGAVVIYELVAGSFVLKQVIDVPGGEPNFGLRLSLDRDRVAVTATVAFSTTNATYVFKRDAGGLWAQQAHLQPPQGDEDQFGVAVDLRGRRLIIGADQGYPARYALIYREVNGQWQQEARIENPPGGSFGRGVEIAGDLAWIGNPNAMTAYEYRRINGTWTLASTLVGTAGPYYGGVLQLRGKRELFVVDNNRTYLYTAGPSGWTLRATFLVPGAAFFDPFNEEELDVSGKRLAAVVSGIAYLFAVPATAN